MIVAMTRVRIIGHKSDLDAALSALQNLANVQLIPASDLYAKLDPYVLAEEQNELETLTYLLARVDALLTVLPSEATDSEQACEYEHLVTDFQADLMDQSPAIESLTQRRQALLHDLEILPSYEKTVSKLQRLAPGLTELRQYETVALLVHRKHRAVIGLLDTEMREIAGDDYELVSDQVDEDNIGAILVFPHAVSNEMQGLLGRVQVSQIHLPESLKDVPFKDAGQRIRQRLRDIPSELAQIDADLVVAAQQHRGRWLAARRLAIRRLEQLRTRNLLGETEYTFVLVGWLPKRYLEPLQAQLQASQPDLIVEELPTAPPDLALAPILLENGPLARAFQFLVKGLALPRYGTIDPSALMALFMPLFFGLMLGDIGYGIVLCSLALILRRRMQPRTGLYDLASFMVMGAAWSIVWGVIFGEFFGSLGHELGLQPVWKERSDPEALPALLLFTIALGAAHLVLGLILGIWQAWQLKHSHQLWERCGLLVGIAGLFFLAGVAAGQLPDGALTPGIAIIVVSLVLLVRGMGALGLIMAPIELLATMGNILSYLRIAAIGLASVYLALVGNVIAGRMGVVWIGVLVALLFHTLNIALGAFSPTIHSLRLHYVEFFSKFYEQGGEPFQPFGAAKG